MQAIVTLDRKMAVQTKFIIVALQQKISSLAMVFSGARHDFHFADDTLAS